MEEMTASEILRRNADDNWSAGVAGIAMALDAAECNGRVFELLANKIDAELDEVKKKAAHATDKPLSEVIAFYTGLYAKGAEPIGDWLDRWFIPRPRFEDGEPVQFGEEVELHYKSGGCDKGRFQEIKYNKGSVWILSFTGVDHAREYRYDSERDTIKRPAPEALGADGLPIVAGETVWLADEYARYAGIGYHDSGCLCGLAGICANDALKIKRIVSERKVALDTDSNAWCPAKWLTHTPHDTQQQIDDDATMPPAEYCAVRGIDLGDDPDREAATTTMVRDLLLRQRELDKLTGGE